jgi:hypothetical protein
VLQRLNSAAKVIQRTTHGGSSPEQAKGSQGSESAVDASRRGTGSDAGQ